LSQITRDHSLLQEQLDAGLITPAQAASALHKNLVTRAVGVEPRTELELHFHSWQPDDLLLLCSDGLSDMLPDADIAALCQRHTALEELGQALVDKANAQGGRDNITVVLGRPARAVSDSAPAQRPWWGIGRR
ncbi:MAG: SpoIIE family protein phosphatase, partial [Inhella sp.]